MHFKSTVVITFLRLVPILSLLASVRAAPSDLQSRGSSPTRPLDISFAQPTYGQRMKPGSVLTLQFFVTGTQNESDPLPPWTVQFWVVLLYDTMGALLRTDDISPGNYSNYEVALPAYIAGLGSIECFYNDQGVGGSPLMVISDILG